MNKSLLSKIKTYLNDRKIKSRRHKIFTGLAMVVVFCTVYALMMPAITMGETLICTEIEHTHTSDCYEEKIICDENSENINDQSCYETVLTYEHEEHTHTSDCYITDSELESINNLISTIDSLPSYEEMNNHIDELTANSTSSEEIDEYKDTIILIASNTYYDYLNMEPKLQNQITNIDKLMEYKEADLINENVNTPTTFDVATPINESILTTVNTASTKEFIELNLYDYSGNINTKYNSDNKYPGFQWNGGAYLNGTYDRHQVDFIDFGNSMITDFIYGSSYNSSNAKSPNAQSIGKLDGSNGAINKLDNVYGITNRPIGMSLNSSITSATEDVLSRTLGSDGYPALKDGTSLSYLFTSGTYATKKNTTSIDGLFQQNKTSGEYHYNSRTNHAQYSNNRFTVYNQIITPNFIVYPFGNFLPLNDITNSDISTQVGSISSIKTYVQGTLNELTANSAHESNPTKHQLVDMLAKYRTDLQSVSTTGGTAWTTWNAKNAIEDYFKTNDSSANNPSDDTSQITDELLNKMYNIDWNVETNFFFGMEMKMNFMQPKGGMTGNDTNNDGESDYPMEFYFTGDDDVWVYIDDVLFLDLSGIHRHVGGEIDFVNGKVYYYHLDTENTGDVSTTPYQTYTFAQILSAAGKSTDGLNSKGTFKDYTTHSFKFYYMERGSGSSVCRLNFNFPLLRQNTISVSKELSVDNEDLTLLGNPDFRFQVFTADSEGNKTENLFITANTTYKIYDENNNEIGTGTTDDNGVFTLKAGQRAEFTGIKENAGKYYVRELLDKDYFEQYGTITVSGESTTTTENDVVLGNDTFTGVDSPVKDMSNGSTNFRFNNQLITNKYGSLKIKKEVDSYQSSFITKPFTFYITLDGNPIPLGTTYTITDENGNKTTKTVETAGYITIYPNETAQIDKIIAGSKYNIEEILSANSGYTVIYNGNGQLTSAEGEITLNQKDGDQEIPSSSITVTNKETGTDLPISIIKNIINPDGKEYTYDFELIEVTDSTGNTEKTITNNNIVGSTINTLLPEGTERIITLSDSISLTNKGTNIFNLSYTQSEIDSSQKVYYYKIVEVSNTDDEYTKYDNTKYVIEVTVTNSKDSEENEIFNAEITKIWSDNVLIWEKSTESLIPPKETLTFTNTLLSKLIISKTVEGDGDTETEFEFEITLQNENESLLKDTYIYHRTINGSDTTTIGNLDFSNNKKATIKIKHNETITIDDIPSGTKYTIKELNTEGYVVKHTIISGETNMGSFLGETTNTVTLKTGENNIVSYINASGHELPDTGSSGMLILIMIGSLLLIVPVIYIGYIIYKHRKKVN